ncbi:MAG: erythromycin esterase family protein [Phycisphaerales bacterium]|nr:erythromycin esterase family protein [Phycisphaerales bacterium]
MHRSNTARCQMLLIAVLSMAIFHQTAQAQDSDPGSRDATKAEFLKWTKREAIHVERWKMNPQLEAFLDTALEGKRILFIGEPGHFFSEKYDVQLMLIRHLAPKGYRHIFIEGLGASMAPAVDHFVKTGKRPGKADGDQSKETAKYQERAFKGWVGAKDPEFKRRQSASQQRFYHDLREICESLADDQGPLRVHPIDIDMMPGGCYLSIADLLGKYPEEALLDPIRKSVKKDADETANQEIKRLEKLHALVSDLGKNNPTAMTRTDVAQLRTYADCLLETTVFFETARADGRLNRALVRREPAMFRQVKHAMDGIAPDAKVIMLAHNNHLCRDGADISRARDPSVGEMIDKAYPGQVFSIWMLHDHGKLLNPMSKQLIDTLESDPRRIEATLIKAGSTYLLPLHSKDPGRRYLDRKRRYSYFSWNENGTLTKQTDALFFIDEISPLRGDDPLGVKQQKPA